MALQSDLVRLRSAWRALSGESQNDGWLTFPLEANGSCNVLAGRHFPGNEEAILVGFHSVDLPADRYLPQGKGFRVEKVKYEIPGNARVWISLSRQPTGSLDMFSYMAEDVLSLLRSYVNSDEQTFFHLFLGRIRAWQEFMHQGKPDVLSPEAEVGLIGELSLLKMLLEKKLPLIVVIESWRGPLDELHDFVLWTGAIEVKSTITASSFPVMVRSLEQLDRKLVSPLFLAGIRLSLDSSGKTLPEFVAELASLLDASPEAKGEFESLILRAGFLFSFSDMYKRRFVQTETRLVPIRTEFPSLTRNKVDQAISKVQYELDLDLVGVPDVSIELVLNELGGFSNGT